MADDQKECPGPTEVPEFPKCGLCSNDMPLPVDPGCDTGNREAETLTISLDDIVAVSALNDEDHNMIGNTGISEGYILKLTRHEFKLRNGRTVVVTDPKIGRKIAEAWWKSGKIDK